MKQAASVAGVGPHGLAGIPAANHRKPTSYRATAARFGARAPERIIHVPVDGVRSGMALGGTP
jgi:hypothetical protein